MQTGIYQARLATVPLTEAPLMRSDLPWLAGAVIASGMLVDAHSIWDLAHE